MQGQIETIRAKALRALIPPPRLRLSEWIEKEIRLPDGLTAQPGPVRLWQFQRDIADAIGDPLIERVTLIKPVRVGFSTILTSAVAAFVANEPSAILCLLPTEADCRDMAVSELEPIFAASPIVADALSDDRDEAGRNTLLSRRFPGGSLKIVAARAPRNLRRHSARVLLIDEADGMDATAEGSPITLAERRTLSFPDRRIIMGSTPVHEETSHVLRAYAQSDQRVFEVPCPECGTFTEIRWEHIVWDPGEPDTARFRCPACEAEIAERHKSSMVAQGTWRATRPEVRGHAGFRMNALVSLHTNASWAKLAAEFLAGKDDPQALQVFTNTILGEAWRGEGEELAEADLAARAEPFSLDTIPAEVLALTAGVDVQHDRLELTFTGWTEAGQALILDHRVIWGGYEDPETWQALDDLLRRRWPHALGGRMALDACAVDAGDGASMAQVLAFTTPRLRARIVAIKGASGMARPIIEKSATRSKTGAPRPLWIVGVDAAKTVLFAKLAQPGAVRFSDRLPEVYYEQLTSERAVVRYRRGAPVRSFERIAGRRAETLDTAVYALAARQLVTIDPERRRAELSSDRADKTRAGPVLKSEWMTRR